VRRGERDEEVVPVGRFGPLEAARIRPRWVERGDEHADERQQGHEHEDDEDGASHPLLASTDDHDSLPRRMRWRGRTTRSTRTMSTMENAEAVPISRSKNAR